MLRLNQNGEMSVEVNVNRVTVGRVNDVVLIEPIVCLLGSTHCCVA